MTNLISVDETKDENYVTYDLQRETHMPIEAPWEPTTSTQDYRYLKSRHLAQSEDEEKKGA